jgi:hypothetical protein
LNQRNPRWRSAPVLRCKLPPGCGTIKSFQGHNHAH